MENPNVSIKAFKALPRRVFLDSCAPQALRNYGGFIWLGEPIGNHDRLHSVTEGYVNVFALRTIFFVNQRALFEWVVSEASLAEAADKCGAGHLQWAHEVLDHTLACLRASGGGTQKSQVLSLRLEEPQFGYLSETDRLLVWDAILLRCDGFPTMKQRLPRNANHVMREVRLRVLKPVQYWELLKPWVGLFV